MTTTSLGRRAEQAAADFLVHKGYEIIDQNWRTKCCEIDIVGRKDNVILFVEVKYRSTSSSGSGLDYITPAKQIKMSRAAESWVQIHNWDGDYQLAAIEVFGKDFTIGDFVSEF